MADETSSAADIATILKDYVPRSDYEAALEALQTATEETETARTEAGKHTERMSELEKKVRGRSYRDAFEKLRKDARVKDEFAQDAFDLLKLEQDKDDPDEKAMKSALNDFLKERKHFVSEEGVKPKVIPAGEGSSRGKSVAPGTPEFRVSYQQRNDALWMRENQESMRQAHRAGVLVLDD
jgi:hypothetical protein